MSSKLDTVVHYMTHADTYGDPDEAREAIADLIQDAMTEELEPVLRRIGTIEAKLAVLNRESAKNYPDEALL